MSDPRLSDQQVAELFAEREGLTRIRDRIASRIQEIDDALHASGEAKLWDVRKKIISEALGLADWASDEDLVSWLTLTSIPGPVMGPDMVRALLSEAVAKDASLYEAWITATRLLVAYRERM